MASQGFHLGYAVTMQPLRVPIFPGRWFGAILVNSISGLGERGTHDCKSAGASAGRLRRLEAGFMFLDFFPVD